MTNTSEQIKPATEPTNELRSIRGNGRQDRHPVSRRRSLARSSPASAGKRATFGRKAAKQ